jgi:hypothetical protein
MNASLLYEMPQKERDEKSQGRYHEEQETGDPGRLSYLRNKDVPNWQRLDQQS